MMTSSNLAICVGPCILWSSDPQVVTGTAYASDVSRVTKLLIDEFAAIFGADVPAIFQTTSNRQNQNNREKMSTEKPASRTPPLVKPSDSVKPFILQRECSSVEWSSINNVTNILRNLACRIIRQCSYFFTLSTLKLLRKTKSFKNFFFKIFYR